MHFLSVRKLEIIFIFFTLPHISSVVWWTCPVSCASLLSWITSNYQNIKSNLKVGLVCAIFSIWVSCFNIHIIGWLICWYSCLFLIDVLKWSWHLFLFCLTFGNTRFWALLLTANNLNLILEHSFFSLLLFLSFF